jgi:hypothetical protein
MPKAVATIIPVSPYHNHSVGDLADEIGKLCAEVADLKARRKVFREELIRRDVADAEGALFRATVSEAVRWTIDNVRVKAEMGAAWWDARCLQSLVTTVDPRRGCPRFTLHLHPTG